MGGGMRGMETVLRGNVTVRRRVPQLVAQIGDSGAVERTS
jgi:hypothetical protein